MAAGTYTRLVAEAMAARNENARISDAAAKAAAQVERAAEVVRRLRDLIRLGRSELAPTHVPVVVEKALELLQPDVDRTGIRIERRLAGQLPPVLADALQLEQVLLNIVRNSIEAIVGSGVGWGM